MSNLNLVGIPPRDAAITLGVFGTIGAVGALSLMGSREIRRAGDGLIQRAAGYGNTWTATAIKACGYATKLLAAIVAMPMILLTTAVISFAVVAYSVFLINNPVITPIITAIAVVALDAMAST